MVPSTALRIPRRLFHADISADLRRGESCAEEGVRGSGSGAAAAAQRHPGRPRHRPGGHGVCVHRPLARRGHHWRARRPARPLHGHRRHGPRPADHHRAAARGRLPGPRRRRGAARPPAGAGRGLRRRRGRRGLRPPLGAARPCAGRVRVHDLLRDAVPAHRAGPAARAVHRGHPRTARRRHRPLRRVVLRAPAAPGGRARPAGCQGTGPDDHPPGDPGDHAAAPSPFSSASCSPSSGGTGRWAPPGGSS